MKYCQGSARKAERILGWNRKTVKLGLEEKRGGITCKGGQSGSCGSKRWEERQPKAASELEKIAEERGQQDPTFKSTTAYTRLTAAQAMKELENRSYRKEELPAQSTMATILNRMGYRLRPVVKAKPQKAVRPRVGDRHKGTRTKRKFL